MDEVTAVLQRLQPLMNPHSIGVVRPRRAPVMALPVGEGAVAVNALIELMDPDGVAGTSTTAAKEEQAVA